MMTACENIRDAMGNQARTTDILVFNRVRHILLQKRDHLPSIQEPGKWDVWGGHCEEGETSEACAICELREEIGVEIADPRTLKLLMTRFVGGREESIKNRRPPKAGLSPTYARVIRQNETEQLKRPFC
jgi:ADP-ribose pyrophosphatase YjhB (NUDIX family)